MARGARGDVIRPIRIFGAIAVSGAIAALLALGGLAVPRGFLAMGAATALAFAVNRRPTRLPRRPALRRGAWIAAAALMLAGLPNSAPQGVYAWGFTISAAELLLVAALVLSLVVALITLARGINADRGDRLLIGVLGGIVAYAALFVTELPPPPAPWLYPFALLLGGALARAHGNLRVP